MTTKKKVRVAKRSQTISSDVLSDVVGGKGKGNGSGYALTVTSNGMQNTQDGFTKHDATSLQSNHVNELAFHDVTSKAREQSLAKHPGKYVGK